jgi:hypothetical protein
MTTGGKPTAAVKLRELLKGLRLRRLQGEEDVPIDNVDAAAVDAVATELAYGPAVAPPNWVPSQQDERPPH